MNPGFDPKHIAHFRMRPSRLGYSVEKAEAFHREVIRRLEALPGVQSVVLGSVAPERGWGTPIPIWLPGQKPARPEQALRAESNSITPRFLETLKIPLVFGRDFNERDRKGAPDVAIVNETLAHRLAPNRDAVRMSIIVDGKAHRVVGVTKDIHPRRSDEAAFPYLYLPYWQRNQVDSRIFVLVAGDPRAMIPRLRREIMAVDPDVHIGQEMPLAERTALTFESERMMGRVLGYASLLAAFLSAVGLYGTLSFSVTRRTREIGIRMALGAARYDVLELVVKQGMSLVLVGVAVGLIASFVLTRLLTAFLYGVTVRDPVTLTGVSLVLAAVALVACDLPARKATRVNPLVALRCD